MSVRAIREAPLRTIDSRENGTMDPFKLGTLALILCVPGSLIAQGMAIPTARLESPVDSVRMNAFYALQAAAYDGRRHPDKPQTTFLADSARVQPALAATLIKLLEFENALVAAAPAGSLSQDYLEDYYTTLQITVARMRDPASAAALMPGITLAIEALASFGDVSFPGSWPSCRARTSTNTLRP